MSNFGVFCVSKNKKPQCDEHALQQSQTDTQIINLANAFVIEGPTVFFESQPLTNNNGIVGGWQNIRNTGGAHKIAQLQSINQGPLTVFEVDNEPAFGIINSGTEEVNVQYDVSGTFTADVMDISSDNFNLAFSFAIDDNINGMNSGSDVYLKDKVECVYAQNGGFTGFFANLSMTGILTIPAGSTATLQSVIDSTIPLTDLTSAIQDLKINMRVIKDS